MTKFIFIDLDETLLETRACANKAIALTLAEEGIECKGDYTVAYHRANDMLWRAHERGEISREEIYARRFCMMFEELGVDADGVAFNGLFRKNFAKMGEKVDGAEELLVYLASKYDVYVTSNSTQVQQETRMNVSGLMPYVKGVFTSELLGAQKPSKEFFERCLQRIDGATKENTVMIGDSLTADVAGAANAGIRAIWFNARGVAVPNDFAGDYAVKRLTEIKGIL
jgi:2-haloacid dehalogenase